MLPGSRGSSYAGSRGNSYVGPTQEKARKRAAQANQDMANEEVGRQV
jgi:hypothetical protein